MMDTIDSPSCFCGECESKRALRAALSDAASDKPLVTDPIFDAKDRVIGHRMHAMDCTCRKCNAASEG
jgi:hypothetical protein